MFFFHVGSPAFAFLSKKCSFLEKLHFLLSLFVALGLLKEAPRHRPERVSPSPAVAQGHRAGRPVRTANGASSHVLPDTQNKREEPPPRKDRNRLAPAVNGDSAAHGAGRKVVVPNLVDEVEDFTEVTALAAAKSCQSLLEDADDDVVDFAASLVQLLGMERTEALSLCAFSQPSTIGVSHVGAVSVECVLLFPAVCFIF